MQQQYLGASEVRCSSVIMGMSQTAKTRGRSDLMVKLARSAFDAGITTFDTAETYGTEQALAEALSDVRDQVVYATKVSADHLSPTLLVQSCEQSLVNLKTDHIDLYQIHWPSGFSSSGRTGALTVPIEKTMGALNQLKQQGKIRAIGLCNFSRSQLAEAAQYGQIDSVQIPYSLFWRQVEMDIIPYCCEHQISVLAYAPLAQGLLTGKFKPGQQFGSNDVRCRNKLFQPNHYNRAQQALEELRPIADRYQTTLSNLALAWLMAQPQTSVIVGASHPEQVFQNAQASEIHLSSRDRHEIDVIGRQVTDYLEDDPVLWLPIPLQQRIQSKFIKLKKKVVNKVRRKVRQLYEHSAS